MVQTPAHSRAEKRAEILRRAADLFRQKGFHETGMRDIARSLGLAPGALYYYFKSKEDLLFGCQTIALDRLLDDAETVIQTDEPADVKLGHLISSHLSLTLNELGGGALHLEFRALPADRLAQVVEKRDTYEGILRDVIRRGVEEGRFRPCDPKVATLFLLGALNWAVIWWKPEGDRGVDELSQNMAKLLMKGLMA